jgi:putative lipoprotein
MVEALRGQFVIGKDGYGLTLCGDAEQHRLQLDEHAEAFLAKFAESGAREFYVEAYGLRPATGPWQLQRFERALAEGDACADTGGTFLFKAVGTEPFWSATAALGQLRFERAGETALAGDISAPQTDADTQRYSASVEGGDITVILSPTLCSDGMSDNLYAWTAELTLAGDTWQGCAYFGE